MIKIEFIETPEVLDALKRAIARAVQRSAMDCSNYGTSTRKKTSARVLTVNMLGGNPECNPKWTLHSHVWGISNGSWTHTAPGYDGLALAMVEVSSEKGLVTSVTSRRTTRFLSEKQEQMLHEMVSAAAVEVIGVPYAQVQAISDDNDEYVTLPWDLFETVTP